MSDTNSTSYTKEDLLKAIDEIVDTDFSDIIETEGEVVEEEIIEKAKPSKVEEEDEVEVEDEEEIDEQEEEVKKEAAKKSLDDEEHGELLRKAQEYDKLMKAQDDERVTLKKALDKIDTLQKSIENLKHLPAEKKSVDGLDVIQKANPEDKPDLKKSAKDVLSKLTKARVASIMTEDLIMKGVEGVSSVDVCEYETNGRLSNSVALERTLEAVNNRYKNGLL